MHLISIFRTKRTYIFSFLLVLFTLSTGMPAFPEADGVTTIKPVNSPTTAPANIYDELGLSKLGLTKAAFDKAVNGWTSLREKMTVTPMLSIADFTQPSTARRLYIIDMQNHKLLFQTFVAHGKNSGENYATSFSNQPESNKSSPGLYLTGDTYIGKHGLSLQLNGLEQGVNDHALQRAIVIHGADYVNESFIQKFGRLGRSLGCPAVPMELCQPIIEQIKSGSCFFIYAPGNV
jgi:hypothetical protein